MNCVLKLFLFTFPVRRELNLPSTFPAVNIYLNITYTKNLYRKMETDV